MSPILRALRRVLGFALALSVAPASAWAEWIDDPENPDRVEVAPSTADDSEDAWIDDPENPASSPIHRAPPRAAALQCPSCPPPASWFRGSYRAGASVDFVRDHAQEETHALDQDLTFRVRHRWEESTLDLEARFSWSIAMPGRDEDSVLLPQTRRARGEWQAELRQALWSRRWDRWLVRAGQQTIAWGSSDLLNPVDVIHPRDFRRGFALTGSEGRLPVPALRVTWLGEPFRADAVLVPVFVPHRVPLLTTRYALLRPPGPVADRAGLGERVDGVLDPAVLPQVEALLLGTEPPAALPGNVSLGLRLTHTSPGQDISIGGYYGWERTPRVTLDPRTRDLLELVGGGAPGATPDLATLLSLLPLLGEAPRDLFRTTYDRRLWLLADGVRTMGPWALRAEATYSPEANYTTRALETLRRPAAAGTLGLSWEGDAENLLVSAEAFVLHTFREEEDGAAWLLPATEVGIAGGLRVRPSAFTVWDTPAGRRWTLLAGGLWAAESASLATSAQVSVEASERTQWSGGFTAFWSLGSGAEGLAAQLRSANHGFVRYEVVF